MRSRRYRTHDSLFTSGLPQSDEDAVKVDDKVGNFKSVPFCIADRRTHCQFGFKGVFMRGLVNGTFSAHS